MDEVVENLDFCQTKSYPEDQIDDENDKLEKEDYEYRINDPVRKYQFDYDMRTCLFPKFPEAISETVEQKTSFAPGEGKVPQNVLHDDDWDIKAFPHLNSPDGKFGLHFQRETRLSNQYYFI